MNTTNTSLQFRQIRIQRGLLFGFMIILALLAFEVFNYSTTDYALTDLLGELDFYGISWATILAIAFCGIDFAGIARLFTPEQGEDEPVEVWYLFGAWLLAATMNAMLTWWGVSIAVLSHETLGNSIIDRGTLLRMVPIFVAVMVWLIRVLIIGTFSLAGDRLFSQAEKRNYNLFRSRLQSTNGSRISRTPRTATAPAGFSPAPKLKPVQRREPTYHPVSMSAPSSPNRSSHRQARKF